MKWLIFVISPQGSFSKRPEDYSSPSSVVRRKPLCNLSALVMGSWFILIAMTSLAETMKPSKNFVLFGADSLMDFTDTFVVDWSFWNNFHHKEDTLNWWWFCWKSNWMIWVYASNTIMLYGKSSTIFHTKSRMLPRSFILELNDWSGLKFFKVIPAAKYIEQSSII